MLETRKSLYKLEKNIGNTDLITFFRADLYVQGFIDKKTHHLQK